MNPNTTVISIHPFCGELRELYYACNDLLTFINSTNSEGLSNNPFLLLEGKAGVGKSHLLADVIETRITSGYPSLLILGQQLTSDESPGHKSLRDYS